MYQLPICIHLFDIVGVGPILFCHPLLQVCPFWLQFHPRCIEFIIIIILGLNYWVGDWNEAHDVVHFATFSTKYGMGVDFLEKRWMMVLNRSSDRMLMSLINSGILVSCWEGLTVHSLEIRPKQFSGYLIRESESYSVIVIIVIVLLLLGRWTVSLIRDTLTMDAELI